MCGQAHGDEGLGSEGMTLEDANIEKLAVVLSIVVLAIIVEVQVSPARGQTHARLVWAHVPRLADKHIHDSFRRLLARREIVEIGHVGDIEIFGGEALVCGDAVWWRDALGYGESGRGRVCGVLDDGAELVEGGGGKKLNWYSDSGRGH